MQAKNLLLILGGNAVLAICAGIFFLPNGIIMGGATGLSQVLGRILPVETAVLVLFINICVFLLGLVVFGKKFALNTAIGTFLYPTLLGILDRIPGIENLTDNSLLAAIYAGALMGLGIGMIMRAGGSTGGMDILALALNKWFHAPVALYVYIIDGIILLCQLLFSTANQVLLGIFALALETLVLNKVMVIGKSQIQLFIISEKYEEIRQKILKDIIAGVTMVYIETGCSREEARGVLCVTQRRKLYDVKQMIQNIDANAFITISEINEVRGRGFTLERKYTL